MKNGTPQTVVIAWADTDAVIAKEGRIDLGERHTFRAVLVGRACMWIAKGTDEDVAKAHAYAAKENASEEENGLRGDSVRRMFVLVYPSTEKDPLGRAKKEVVRGRK